MKARSLLPWLLASALAAGVSAQDPGKDDLKRLEGTWRMVSGEADGKKAPEEELKKIKVIFKGDAYTVMSDGRVEEKGTQKLDPTKKPKTIDYTMTEGPTKGKTHLGIYELDGDTVKFCFAAPGGDRPTDFTAKEGSQRTLSVWKRDKK